MREVSGPIIAIALVLVAVFLPVLALVDRAARMIAPDRPASDDPGSPRYLDEGALDTPSVALTGATREALGEYEELLKEAMNDPQAPPRNSAQFCGAQFLCGARQRAILTIAPHTPLRR